MVHWMPSSVSMLAVKGCSDVPKVTPMTVSAARARSA
jgi:hypothetical protein